MGWFWSAAGQVLGQVERTDRRPALGLDGKFYAVTDAPFESTQLAPEPEFAGQRRDGHAAGRRRDGDRGP